MTEIIRTLIHPVCPCCGKRLSIDLDLDVHVSIEKATVTKISEDWYQPKKKG